MDHTHQHFFPGEVAALEVASSVYFHNYAYQQDYIPYLVVAVEVVQKYSVALLAALFAE